MEGSAAEKSKNLGNDQYKLGNFQKAIEFYCDAIEINNQEPAYYTNRAIAHLQLAQYEQARGDCQAALRIDENFAKAYNRLSKCNVFLGELAEASVNLQRSIALEPNAAANKKDQKALNDLKVTETVIEKALTNENYESAVTNLTAMLKECRSSLNHICLKIDCLLKAFMWSEASTFTKELMSAQEWMNNPKILCWRGRVLYYNGNEPLGMKHLQQALRSDPDLPECQRAMKSMKKSNTMKEEAAALFKQGELAAAIAKFEECLQIDPLNAHYNAALLLNTAIALVKQDKKDDAMRALNRALKYNPNYAKALVKRGEVHVSLGDHDDAIRDFAAASSIDSSGFDVQRKLKEAQQFKKQAGKKDLYKVLGVADGKKASDAVLKKAYRKAALQWHPDKNSESKEQAEKAEKKFKEVNEAWAILGNKDKRQLYDDGGDPEEIGQGRGGGGFPGGGGMRADDMQDIFSFMMGGGGRGGFPGGGGSRGGRGRGQGQNPFGGMNFGDFGGQGGQSGFTFRFG